MDVYPGVKQLDFCQMYDATGLSLIEYPKMTVENKDVITESAINVATNLLQYNSTTPVSIVAAQLSQGRNDKATILVGSPQYVAVQNAIKASEARKKMAINRVDIREYKELRTNVIENPHFIKFHSSSKAEEQFHSDCPTMHKPHQLAERVEFSHINKYRKLYPFYTSNINTVTKLQRGEPYTWSNILLSMQPDKSLFIEQFISACVLRGIELSREDIATVHLVYQNTQCQMEYCLYKNIQTTDGDTVNKSGPILLPNFLYDSALFDSFEGCERILVACRLIATYITKVDNPVLHDLMFGKNDEAIISEPLYFQFACTICSLVLRNTHLSSTADIVNVYYPDTDDLVNPLKQEETDIISTNFIPPETITVTEAPKYFVDPSLNLLQINNNTHLLTYNMYAVNILQDMCIYNTKTNILEMKELMD